MKIRLALIIFYLLASYLTCRPQVNIKTEKEGREVFLDQSFSHGFALSPLDPKIVEQGGGFEKTNVDTLFWGNENQSPVWQLSQWYSKYNLAHVKPELASDGSITFHNEEKRLVHYPDGSILLELTTSKEYNNPRKSNENWPHILIEQKFGSQSPVIGHAKELFFSMEIKLVKCENKMKEGTFNEKLHTAQSPFYFVLKDCNKESEDSGKYLWFGIPSFDYRYKRTGNEEKVSWDIGTSSYIYCVPEMAIWGDVRFQDGKWHKGQADILPLLKRALETMKSKGAFANTSLDDFRITGMNFGWEIPGTFDAALCVKNFSLLVKEK